MREPLRLLVTDTASTKFAGHVRDGLDQGVFDAVFPDVAGEAALRALAPQADAILCYQAELTGAVIQAAPRLKFIQKHGLNCRNIDLAAATARGIPVATLPLLRNVTVAEHALALMLACARKIIPGHQAVMTASYARTGLQPTPTTQGSYCANWAGISGMTELHESTVGIVGMGDIGIEIAKRCRAFGMRVVYHQRTPLPPATQAALETRHLALDTLLTTADFVVLALPHTPQTENIINAATLARMKPTATLINVGRGALVDEAALAHALRHQQIAMAALDVYPLEPLPATSPLMALTNVVLTPHTGGGSYRSWEIDMPAALANIQRYFEQGQASGVINA